MSRMAPESNTHKYEDRGEMMRATGDAAGQGPKCYPRRNAILHRCERVCFHAWDPSSGKQTVCSSDEHAFSPFPSADALLSALLCLLSFRNRPSQGKAENGVTGPRARMTHVYGTNILLHFSCPMDSQLARRGNSCELELLPGPGHRPQVRTGGTIDLDS